MAMSQRAGAYNSISGTGSNRGRPQRNRQRLPATRPVYEDFRPLSEWKTENEALILLVRIPGFLKEQINYTKDDSKRYIRIYGERALADNRRLRFNITYTIPQNCNFNQITTQFDRGILNITIPKLYDLTTTPNVPQQDQETSTSQEKPTTRPQKSDEETFTFGTNKQEKEEEEVAGKTLSGKDSTAKRVDDERVAKEKNLELKKKEDSIGDRKTEDKAVLIARKLVIEEKNKSDDDDHDHENEKPNKEENEVKKGQAEKENVEMAMKEVKNSEERQLVVNICVGVMVIVGLGLDLFTTFG